MKPKGKRKAQGGPCPAHDVMLLQSQSGDQKKCRGSLSHSHLPLYDRKNEEGEGGEEEERGGEKEDEKERTTSTSLTPSENKKPLLFTPEYEIEAGNGQDSQIRWDMCKKNEGHTQFIPFETFQLKDLPQEMQHQQLFDRIQTMCNMTVKVIVTQTSKNRPESYPFSKSSYPWKKFKGTGKARRVGTGFIWFIHFHHVQGGACPCSKCEESPHPETGYQEVTVVTSTHVIYDDSEASRSVFECCFHSHGSVEEVGVLYGLNIINLEEGVCRNPKGSCSDYGNDRRRYLNDVCKVRCVTHDGHLIAKLYELSELKSREDEEDISSVPTGPGVIVSHPHGCSKHVTIGEVLYYIVPSDPDVLARLTCEFGEGSKYRLSVGPTQNQQASIAFSDDTSGPDTVEHHLPKGAKFTLPSDCNYLCRFTQDDVSKSKWITLPPSTQFFLSDGHSLDLPPDTQFFSETLMAFIKKQGERYVAYSIPTCPGTSGAPVLAWNRNAFTPWLAHAGALNDGTNRSVLDTSLTWKA